MPHFADEGVQKFLAVRGFGSGRIIEISENELLISIGKFDVSFLALWENMNCSINKGPYSLLKGRERPKIE